MANTSIDANLPYVAYKPAERRRHSRYPFTATLEAFEPTSQARIQGRTADLSEGGCYVDTMSPFPPGTSVRVRVSREKRTFESQATVVYAVSGMGMGLRFEAIEPQQLASLNRWLGELNGNGLAEVDMEEPEEPRIAANSGQVLNQLISELMRKGVLQDSLGKEMLQRLA
jgi:hypothetical protein